MAKFAANLSMMFTEVPLYSALNVLQMWIQRCRIPLPL